jgi:MFS transporter, PPP family, 3-phenylpropionic acid transporter
MDATALPRFIALFSMLYLAFGVASPFLPAFLESRGLAPEQIGVVLASGTAIRLLSGPTAGRVADWLQALRIVLAVCTALAAGVVLGFLPAQGFWLLLFVSLLQAAMLAPTTTLADALALGASRPRVANGFEYGWVRGAGSAAFIVGLMMSGQAVNAFGLMAIIVLQATFLLVAAASATIVPELVRRPEAESTPAKTPAGSVRDLLRLPLFRRLVLVAALILGSHAMHDSFAMIRWNAAGIDAGTSSILWAESVAAEVLVFFLLGPFLLRHITPASAMAIAACAGALRWIVMAQTADVVAMALVEPLHGLTFALLHLACMRVLALIVPPELAGTAQAIYGTLGIGATSAVLTLASGALYANFGAAGFWAMAALCAVALPLTLTLRVNAAASVPSSPQPES